MEQLRGLLNDVRAWFERLSTRERRMVLATGGAVLAFALFLLLYSFSKTATTYQKNTQTHLTQLHEVQDLAANYQQAKSEREAVEAQLAANAVRLVSYIEDKATVSGLTVPNMTPRPDRNLADGQIIESSVEVTFTDVDLRKLYDFLRSVEQGPGVVKVISLRLEPHDAAENMTAWTTVATYKKK